uniref:Uncharacterized protein n=1 Tax=Kalanchoe fedtschenkoi TaxID=63787 RepID=A0A7N0UIP2_KALFE
MEKHKQLDREIRDMIAALTKRLAELQHIHKSGTGSASSHGNAHGDSSHHQLHHDDEQHGVRIITLAGSNQGATMHGEATDDKSAVPEDADPYEALGTYVNSNFQAINNSIMIGGSYTSNDPGVHMDVSDVIDHQLDHHHGQKKNADEKNGKKMKKEEEENSKSEQHQSDKSD